MNKLIFIIPPLGFILISGKNTNIVSTRCVNHLYKTLKINKMKHILVLTVIICLCNIQLIGQIEPIQTRILPNIGPLPTMKPIFPKKGTPYGNPFRIYESKYQNDVEERRYLTYSKRNSQFSLQSNDVSFRKDQVFYPFFDNRVQDIKGGLFKMLNLLPMVCQRNLECAETQNVVLELVSDGLYRIRSQNVCLTSELRFEQIDPNDGAQLWRVEEYTEKDYYFYIDKIVYRCIRKNETSDDETQAFLNGVLIGGSHISSPVNVSARDQSGRLEFIGLADFRNALGIEGDQWRFKLIENDNPPIDPNEELISETFILAKGSIDLVTARPCPTIDGCYSVNIKLRKRTQ